MAGGVRRGGPWSAVVVGASTVTTVVRVTVVVRSSSNNGAPDGAGWPVSARGVMGGGVRWGGPGSGVWVVVVVMAVVTVTRVVSSTDDVVASTGEVVSVEEEVDEESVRVQVSMLVELPLTGSAVVVVDALADGGSEAGFRVKVEVEVMVCVTSPHESALQLMVSVVMVVTLAVIEGDVVEVVVLVAGQNESGLQLVSIVVVMAAVPVASPVSASELDRLVMVTVPSVGALIVVVPLLVVSVIVGAGTVALKVMSLLMLAGTVVQLSVVVTLCQWWVVTVTCWVLITVSVSADGGCRVTVTVVESSGVTVSVCKSVAVTVLRVFPPAWANSTGRSRPVTWARGLPPVLESDAYTSVMVIVVEVVVVSSAMAGGTSLVVMEVTAHPPTHGLVEKGRPVTVELVGVVVVDSAVAGESSLVVVTEVGRSWRSSRPGLG